MSAIQKIFRIYGKQYLELYGDRMPWIHKKVIKDICDCRSGSFGTILYACHDCQTIQSIPCCCGNRHCPTCQQGKADQWLHKQMDNLLPTHYFLLTITLPQGLRDIARSHQKTVYATMFSCAHEALRTLARDKRFVGSSRIGYLAVLHTWGNMLQYHPHIHLVIPGGAVSEDGKQWLSSRQDLFVHTKPLALIFKAKFRDAMKKAHLLDKIDPSVWKQQWVVDSQSVGEGQNSLRYLARYVFRVAISNNRIKSIENNVIRFTYKDHERKTWKTMELDAMEFIRRFLQHVVPKGFMKIRHYGFLNPNSAFPIEKLRELISLIHKVISDIAPQIPVIKKHVIKCPCCGNPLTFIGFLKHVPRWGPSG
ncbi:MAG: transposase [Candidatus Aenigmatarchaeota archaeon]|nr:MAG: transposase [Candidatus Aenigmarchaeota archaeon]